MIPDDSDDEPFFFRRRARGGFGDLDITPMIDVTFLLLIFFMVSSTMKPPANADVPPARYGVGADAGDAVVVSVMQSEGEPVVRLPDGTATTLPELRRTDALFRLVEAAKAGDPPRNEVLLNADRDLPHGVVRELSQMIGRSPGVRLFLGVQDK